MDNTTELIYKYLQTKYKRATIGKKELASELGVAPSTIDLYMSKGMGIPPYRKLGEARNAKVIWNIVDIAEYLTQTIKTV